MHAQSEVDTEGKGLYRCPCGFDGVANLAQIVQIARFHDMECKDR